MQKHYSLNIQEQTEIVTGSHILETLPELLKPYNHSSYMVFCSETTEELFSKKVVASLRKLNVPVHVFAIGNGEKEKTMASVQALLAAMLTKELDRKSALVALGGGVIGDIATLVAGLYHRGIDCIQVPTTLLSQVDSSLGGKGGVNIDPYKNIVGLIRQPRVVIADTALLESLPEDQVQSGMGEILKYAIAHDKNLFEKLENEDVRKNLVSIIDRCIDLKMETVQKDPLDTGDERVALNFGHTFGHAVERLQGLSHGEAVAVGMTYALKLSKELGLIQEDVINRAIALIKKYDLPVTTGQMDMDTIFSIMLKDKKTIRGQIRFVLIKDIGQAVISDAVSDVTIKKILSEVLI